MNLAMRVSIGLVFMAGSMISATAQAPGNDWRGEWGSFARVPAGGVTLNIGFRLRRQERGGFRRLKR